jgi:hypothetical protein
MKFFLAAAFCAVFCTGADVRSNNARSSYEALEVGYRQMYNLQFDEAHRTFHQWEIANPSDPLGPASDAAAYLFSEFDRLHILQSEFFAEDKNFLRAHKLAPDPAAKAALDSALDQSSRLSAASVDSNSLFAQVLEHGLRSDYAGLVEKRYTAALNETKQARAAAERLLAAYPDFYDANLAVGVENYLLSLKPAPVRWVLHATGAETDKDEGIEKLRLTAEKGRLLAPFAKLLLAVAALRDKDRGAARAQLAWLAEHFPLNRLFREELAKVE